MASVCIRFVRLVIELVKDELLYVGQVLTRPLTSGEALERSRGRKNEVSFGKELGQ